MSAQPDSGRASERGHWYWPDGKPAYQVPGAKKDTQVTPDSRHAEKFGLVKSVTTIIRDQLPKPSLEAWKFKQGIMAALTLPRNAGETDVEFMDRIEQDSKAYAKQRALEGEAVHATIADFMQTGSADIRYVKYAQMAVKEVAKFPAALIDFKTKDTLRDTFGNPKSDKALFFAEHIIQLAAYREGLIQGRVHDAPKDAWGFETSFAHPSGFGGRVDCYHGPVLALSDPLVSILIGMKPIEIRVYVWTLADCAWGALRFQQLLEADKASRYRLHLEDKA